VSQPRHRYVRYPRRLLGAPDALQVGRQKPGRDRGVQVEEPFGIAERSTDVEGAEDLGQHLQRGEPFVRLVGR
jgi:hypothetical protein